jgi:hypothetical protein
MTPIVRLTAAALLVSGTGCIPYTVGTTAQTERPGHSSRTMSMYVIPNGISLDTARTQGHSLRGSDIEVRWGLDSKSDIGLRIPSASGAVVTYKRRLGADTSSTRAAVAVMGGGGMVNFGEHALAQLTLIASGRQSLQPGVSAYGGLHAVQVAPLSSGATHDTPTIGIFTGIRIGDRENAISPELALFYDHSALHIRRGDLLIVPSITVRGDVFRMLPRFMTLW